MTEPSSSARPAGLSGRLVDHYRIGERLGAGGMGEVYRAEDTRLGRAVAIKVLHAGHDTPEERARLMREARAASVLRSSSVAAIYDLGEHEASPFIVMELVDGEPVSARLARGPLPVADAVAIARQASDALDEAHRHGILHRDVKSANLMVDGRGRVKLLDFGLAKFLEGVEASDLAVTGALETRAGTVMGTFAYMSPEQVRGRTLDARSDLFSLGVVLYEMLAGRLPFDGATATEMADRILNHDPPAIARFNYGVPERLDAIVLKALAKDVAFRYQSARELYIDLHGVGRALDGDESARSSRTGTGSGPASVRVRGDSGAEGVVSPPAVPTIAVMTFSNITREPADDWIGSGIAETLTAELKALRGVAVVSRTQVFDAIKHLSGPALERVEGIAIDIGRRLGATVLVGGGYQRLGPRIRITAEAVDVASGAVVRSVKVDGRVEDMFVLQDRLVDELRQGLRLSMSASGAQALGRKETESLEAYEAHSRGMVNLRLATRDSLDQAVVFFEQAIALDPAYASSWAMIGVARSMQAQFLSQPVLLDQAIAALDRARELDPRNVYALTGLASAYLTQGRSDEAIATVTRALDIDPDHVMARGILARAFWVGKGLIREGIAALDRALLRSPDAGYIHQQLALLLAIVGDLGRAEDEAGRAVALQEALKSGTEGLLMVGSHVRFGYIRYRQGRYDEALEAFVRERSFLGAHDHALKERLLIEIAQKQSAALWRKGDREGADRAFDDAVTAYRARRARGLSDPFTTYYVAALHALREDQAEAVRLLAECAAVLPALTRARARLDPDFDPIRDTAPFQALVGEDGPR